MGLNSINKAEFFFPKTELDWSIPPIAVPTSLSYLITCVIKSSFDMRLCRSYARKVANALHTQKEEELERPEPVGTFPSISIFSPKNSLLLSLLMVFYGIFL